MARTIVKVYASAEERAAAAERSKRRCAGMLKAARIKTPEEIAALPPVKGAERVRARVSEDSETEPDDESFASPQPLQVIKLSAQARVGGSRFWWRGRLRGGGADVLLEGAWVRQNFKRYGLPDRSRAHDRLRAASRAPCTSLATRRVPPRSPRAHEPRSGSGAGLEHLFRACCRLASP